MSHQLSLILALPLAGALVVLLLPAAWRAAAAWFAAVVALVDVAAALPLWTGYDPQNAAFQFLERLPIVHGIGFDYFVGVDGFSALLILMTTMVGAVVMLVPALDAGDARPSKQTCAQLLVLQGALVAAFMALDFLLFFLSVAGALGAVWRLGRATGTKPTGFRFAPSATIALAALFAAMVMLYLQHRSATGVLSFDMTELHKLTLPATTQISIFLLLLVAFAMLLGLVPFHAWFVRAGARAPLAVVAMISAAFVKLGSYGLLRIALPIVPGAASLLASFVAWLCVGGAAVVLARLLTERDWRRAIAHVSLLQLTLLVLGAFAFTDVALSGSMLQQIAHGVSIAALALLAPADASAVSAAPWRRALVVIAALAAVGVPFSGGFASARLMVSGLQSEHPVRALAMVAAMAAAAVGVLRLCWLTFVRADLARGPRVEGSALQLLAAVPLLAAAFWIGIQPAPFLDRLRVSAHHVVSHVNPAAGNAADCDTIPTPEKLESTPGAQFLSAVPCGPDGEPLQPSTTSPQPGDGRGR
jgi:NADH-quinone oxidoreductase subunit M